MEIKSKQIQMNERKIRIGKDESVKIMNNRMLTEKI